MKYFQVEQNKLHRRGMMSTQDHIVTALTADDPCLGYLELPDKLYRCDITHLFDAMPGKVFWTDNIDKDPADYITSFANELFDTKYGEIWVIASDLSNLLTHMSMAEIIKAPIRIEQGYNFADKLFSLYGESVSKSGLTLKKNVPNSILVLDMLIPLAIDSQNYLKGMQTKWNEHKPNKPEIYVLTGERTSN